MIDRESQLQDDVGHQDFGAASQTIRDFFTQRDG